MKTEENIQQNTMYSAIGDSEQTQQLQQETETSQGEPSVNYDKSIAS